MAVSFVSHGSLNPLIGVAAEFTLAIDPSRQNSRSLSAAVGGEHFGPSHIDHRGIIRSKKFVDVAVQS